MSALIALLIALGAALVWAKSGITGMALFLLFVGGVFVFIAIAAPPLSDWERMEEDDEQARTLSDWEEAEEEAERWERTKRMWGR